MTGGYYIVEVKKIDDSKALITIEKAEFHSDEPEKKEYLVDVSIMEKLEKLIRKYRMNLWHRKTFTNMFVCDGESYSYEFEFDNVRISFSSQIYPKPYGDKLSELREVVKEYVEGA